MGTTYTYDRAQSRRLMRHLLIILLLSLVIIGGIGILIFLKTHTPSSPVEGASATVAQNQGTQHLLQVQEPLFSMDLPADWKQTGSVNTSSEHSISWQATSQGSDNRFLKLYIDTIPVTRAVNRELPVAVAGNQLQPGQLSDNCATFTLGGTLDVAKASALKPAPSTWQGVNFICDLHNVVNDYVGTGSSAGVNTITMTGASGGTHNYFFLYNDQNIDPDYTILENAIQSFQAK